MVTARHSMCVTVCHLRDHRGHEWLARASAAHVSAAAPVRGRRPRDSEYREQRPTAPRREMLDECTRERLDLLVLDEAHLHPARLLEPRRKEVDAPFPSIDIVDVDVPRNARTGSAFDGRPTLRCRRSSSVSKLVTGGSASTRWTLLRETPTSLAVSSRLWPRSTAPGSRVF